MLLEGGGLPRSPSAPRALLGMSARSSAKPSHNTCGLPPTNTFRPLAPILSNLARNSSAAPSNIEFASLELQRFPAVSKNYRLKLCAKFVWARPAIARRHRGQALPQHLWPTPNQHVSSYNPYVAMHPIRRDTPDQKGCNAYRSGAPPPTTSTTAGTPSRHTRTGSIRRSHTASTC